MRFLTEIQFATTGSMESPPVGYITLYANTDGNLYAETPDGNQVKLSINTA
jgi:hypothetical protein